MTTINITPEKVGGVWNTQNLYETIHHTHLSFFIDDDIHVDVMIAECRSGKWFTIDDVGNLPRKGLLDSVSSVFLEPSFLIARTL